ncbi:hypothetical protein TNCV_3741991 [Trichonephila clavipes]|nr:hypothetical protein TNCV_3741991 [Trichonephila clavipes]
MSLRGLRRDLSPVDGPGRVHSSLPFTAKNGQGTSLYGMPHLANMWVKNQRCFIKSYPDSCHPCLPKTVNILGKDGDPRTSLNCDNRTHQQKMSLTRGRFEENFYD